MAIRATASMLRRAICKKVPHQKMRLLQVRMISRGFTPSCVEKHHLRQARDLTKPELLSLIPQQKQPLSSENLYSTSRFVQHKFGLESQRGEDLGRSPQNMLLMLLVFSTRELQLELQTPNMTTCCWLNFGKKCCFTSEEIDSSAFSVHEFSVFEARDAR